MPLIDSHSHIDFSEFYTDRQDAIKRAKNIGVSHIMVSATTAQRWQNIKEVVASSSLCFAAYGLHPMFLKEHKREHLDDLKNWVEKEKPSAIGEIGLDYFIQDTDQAEQLAFFVSQLEIANHFKLPVIIHARKSLDIVLKHLRQFNHLTGSIHSFSGSEQQAKQLIDLGFYLGFGGPITYTRATRLRSLVEKLPLESILIETDSPDQPDTKHWGERNEPAFLPIIADTIAELRNISVEDVAKITSRNAQTLFNF